MTDDQPQTLVSHLLELRTRLLRCVLCVLLVFIGLFLFANDLYLILVRPLDVLIPDGNMIATGVLAPFLVPFKLTLVLSLYISMPFILHQVWGFISPALYQHEKRLAVPLLLSSIVLFYAGIAFAYFVLLPLAFAFFVAVGPEGISYLPDIGSILDFILAIFFAFGLAFEIPIATFLLVVSGFTTAESLSQKRPYVFLGCFVVGMLLTPPDVLSQTILAIPMWLLFELGIFAARFVKKPAGDETISE